ncbi:CBS domain containing-hemolysin-like protein [Saccharothrix coeruleofusca]|uniref:hemolysin family protein n=1 Tax=Saccharothrix coeruleofusca TaxID=33919 RepID=UPI001AE638F1|nr:hemolysin family protein [Saccharothrix coeruleofusca]MBP2337950.1 CBS domain containing-hemolysin-like protein [Saccharothrix coeruleofusca]
MSEGWALVTAVLLLAGNAFFVGAEFALISARRDRLETMLERGVSRAATVIAAGREVSLMLAGAQLGITICSLLLGRLAEPAVAHLLEAALHPLPVPPVVLHAVAFTIAMMLVVAAHMLLGEMVPKNLAIANPERLAIWLVPVHVAFVRLVRPFIGLFNLAANGVLKLAKVQPKDELESAYTPDELSLLIAQSRQEGLLEDSEHRRLAQTLSSAERTVADVLVPLERVTSVSSRPTMGEVESAVAATGFSRFPVADGDRLTGYLHIKDVLDLAGADASTRVPAGRIRGLPEVPVDARLDEALAALRRTQSHLARAVSPEGGLRGVVALEDLLEEYVGTVRDGTHVRREL